jgi:hypothetical protein
MAASRWGLGGVKSGPLATAEDQHAAKAAEVQANQHPHMLVMHGIRANYCRAQAGYRRSGSGSPAASNRSIL